MMNTLYLLPLLNRFHDASVLQVAIDAAISVGGRGNTASNSKVLIKTKQIFKQSTASGKYNRIRAVIGEFLFAS